MPSVPSPQRHEHLCLCASQGEAQESGGGDRALQAPTPTPGPVHWRWGFRHLGQASGGEIVKEGQGSSWAMPRSIHSADASSSLCNPENEERSTPEGKSLELQINTNTPETWKWPLCLTGTGWFGQRTLPWCHSALGPIGHTTLNRWGGSGGAPEVSSVSVGAKGHISLFQ